MTGLPDGARLGSAGRDGSAGGGRGLPNLPNQKTSASPRLCAFALKSILAVLVFGLAVCARADMAEQVRLDMFFSAGCTECERVKREVLRSLRRSRGLL
jgi:hypothetical protein